MLKGMQVSLTYLDPEMMPVTNKFYQVFAVRILDDFLILEMKSGHESDNKERVFKMKTDVIIGMEVREGGFY
jgi:hypothetical protein